MDTILSERRRLGPLQCFTIEAPSLVAAHRELGAILARPARAAIHARLATTRPEDLTSRLRAARASRAFMEARAADPRVPVEVRRAVGDYLACLDAWAHAAGAGEWLSHPLVIDGRRASAEDLALWAQDDNTGCQTGMLRQADGSVLLWHTEEDRLGLLDEPRLATFVVGGERLSAFLYPYLLPGPAFGFREDQVHAVDSLVLKRGLAPRGAFTSVASWLIWRLGSAVPARETLRALTPYLDGCAINVARPSGSGVLVETHEIGGRHVQSHVLGPRPGAFSVQANAVRERGSRLAEHEDLSARRRAVYDQRIARVSRALANRLGAEGEPGPEHVLSLLANRRGGSYAFANLTVKAHAVARVSPDGFEIHIRSGAAHPDDVYHPAWRSRGSTDVEAWRPAA
ncbi:MAG: hypothetical protein QM820_40965 [Minicystis sp.]